jgi:nucleotide-binding universal stress UspA family protein
VGHVLLGTTVERLVNGAPCPIAVVPQGWQPAEGLHAIGVGYVESDEATDALRAAHTLARRAGATLQVITVATVNYGLYAQARPGEVVYPPDAIAEVEAEERAWAEQALHAAIAKLGGDVPVDAQTVVSRSPAEPLISASAHLDLLVCGSRGYGPVRSVLLGGVTRRVAAAAQCPVMVVPRGTRGALESLMTDVGVPVAA